MVKLSFKPKELNKKLLGSLPERGRDVLSKRYGLGKDSKRLTLEFIGQEYSITRERVRQIEDYAINQIRKSEFYRNSAKLFEEIKKHIFDLGGIVSESELLNYFSNDESIKRHIHFLLVLGSPFEKRKEDDSFNARWYIDKALAEKVESSLKKLYVNLKNEDIVPESEIVKNFLEQVKDLSEEYKNEEIIRRWMNLSKKISKNPFGEWGRTDSSNINVKGIRDYAYLVLRKHGSPIHFREVAEAISKLFNKKAHVATCHNELIKDQRFVLVGRGLYALKEWGYSAGIVKDVIKEIIEKHGPLTKKEIIDKVLKERYVKESTIVVNLQNQKFFKKDIKGRYSIA